MDAEVAQKAADGFSKLPEKPAVGTGGELMPIGKDADARPGLLNTMQNPDAVTYDASLERVELAESAHVSDLAFDMAETIQAENSIEKSLAHQMAAAHSYSMKLLADADRQKLPVEKVRMINAAARLMTVFQEGASTLAKLT
jgi:ABC-type branched-subunit amino acid transport system ATPase component